jgi:PAS domain S-box-containing protein
MNECNPVDALPDVLMEVPDLVTAYTADGRYLFVNTAAAEFLGADPLDVIGRSWRELGYPDYVMEPLMERVVRVSDAGAPQYYNTITSPEMLAIMRDVCIL